MLEQTVADRGYGALLLSEEAERWGIALTESDLAQRGYSRELIERNSAELDLATDVIAGSEFVAQSLARTGVDRRRIHLVPYGVDTRRFSPRFRHRRAFERLDVAFVGSDGLRKGLMYLLEAAEQLGRGAVHIHVFDSTGLPSSLLSRHRRVATFHGHIGPEQLVAGLQTCHVGALPSLIEGSALSVYEMLASGLPTVVTPNTGAVVRDGVDGFVVPIRDTTAVAAALHKLLDEDLRAEMAREATVQARRHSWARYRTELARSLGVAS